MHIDDVNPGADAHNRVAEALADYIRETLDWDIVERLLKLGIEYVQNESNALYPIGCAATPSGLSIYLEISDNVNFESLVILDGRALTEIMIEDIDLAGSASSEEDGGVSEMKERASKFIEALEKTTDTMKQYYAQKFGEDYQ